MHKAALPFLAPLEARLVPEDCEPVPKKLVVQLRAGMEAGRQGDHPQGQPYGLATAAADPARACARAVIGN